MSGKRRAVFLDRDGTINAEKKYLHKIEDFEFIPGVPDAIRRLKNAGFMVIVVSNQSGIARGFYNEHAVDQLHRHIQEELARRDTSIDDFYICPHHPEEGTGEYRVVCSCRKGDAGMLLQAALDHDIDLSQSFMVGDKPADVAAGERAGCQSILVLTGYGTLAAEKPELAHTVKCLDLAGAATLILEQFSARGQSC